MKRLECEKPAVGSQLTILRHPPLVIERKYSQQVGANTKRKWKRKIILIVYVMIVKLDIGTHYLCLRKKQENIVIKID